MFIDCISDLHGYYPKLEGGDLLIVAGDLTASNHEKEYYEFLSWLRSQKYNEIVVIAGNHDGLIEEGEVIIEHHNYKNIHYLCDSGMEYNGLKIWGSPWTPTFFHYYFMKDRGPPIREKWDLIPKNTDVLITHGPPYGILDKCHYDCKLVNVGCEELRKVTLRIKPKLMVFGHIHEHGGKIFDTGITKCVNASHVNENYRPVNRPTRIEL